MTTNHTIAAAGPTSIKGMKLMSIAHATYANDFKFNPTGVEGFAFTLLRTTSGAGLIELELNEQLQTIQLPSGSLILVDDSYLKSYQTTESPWNCWWLEFQCDDPDSLPFHRVLNVPVDPSDDDVLHKIGDLISHKALLERQYGTACFAMLLHKWFVECDNPEEATPNISAVERVIQMMHENTEDPLSVETMAKEAGLGMVRFRQLFIDETGLTPKKYYTRIRLDQAIIMLKSGMSVHEVAARLGYADQFHFSRAFRKQFSISPSKIKTHNKT